LMCFSIITIKLSIKKIRTLLTRYDDIAIQEVHLDQFLRHQ
jgi:hypothetical protein